MQDGEEQIMATRREEIAQAHAPLQLPLLRKPSSHAAYCGLPGLLPGLARGGGPTLPTRPSASPNLLSPCPVSLLPQSFCLSSSSEL
eukprot:766508-Hanusia_phi.AAC.1